MSNVIYMKRYLEKISDAIDKLIDVSYWFMFLFSLTVYLYLFFFEIFNMIYGN